MEAWQLTASLTAGRDGGTYRQMSVAEVTAVAEAAAAEVQPHDTLPAAA